MASVVEIKFSGGGIQDGDVAPGAAIAATKLKHQFPISQELFAPGVTIAALTRLLHIVRGAKAEVVGFEAIITTAATDASRTVTVDLLKSTGGGAFATILTTTINITSTTTIRVPVAAVVASPSLVDGDILELTVAVAGSTGAQAQGLLASVMLREDPT